MFEAFMITLIIVGWYSVFRFLLPRSLDGSVAAMVGVIMVVVWTYCVVVFLSLYGGVEEAKHGNIPSGCVLNDHAQMMYNAVTKMMQPAKFCVQRGEWEE